MSSVPTMTTTEYAAHRGCSDSYIRRMKRQGKVVTSADGKRIRVPETDALLDDITDQIRGGDRTAPEAPPIEPFKVPAGASVQEAMRRERLALAQLAELKLGELSGQLTRTQDVDRVLVTLIRQALNSMQGMGYRLRAKLAAETDPRACEAMLDAEIRQIALNMQTAARAMRPRNTPHDAPDAEACPDA